MSTAPYLSLFCLALPLVACQAPPPSWVPGHAGVPDLSKSAPEKKSAEENRQAEVIGIEASITRLGSGEVLAVSRGRMRADGTFSFSTSKDGEPGGAVFKVHVQPQEESAFTASVQWDETTAEGRVVKWSPTMAVADGAEAVNEIAWADGDGRRLSLKLTRDAPPEALAASAAP
jgi:hypothetical protein